MDIRLRLKNMYDLFMFISDAILSQGSGWFAAIAVESGLRYNIIGSELQLHSCERFLQDHTVRHYETYIMLNEPVYLVMGCINIRNIINQSVSSLYQYEYKTHYSHKRYYESWMNYTCPRNIRELLNEWFYWSLNGKPQIFGFLLKVILN